MEAALEHRPRRDHRDPLPGPAGARRPRPGRARRPHRGGGAAGAGLPRHPALPRPRRATPAAAHRAVDQHRRLLRPAPADPAPPRLHRAGPRVPGRPAGDHRLGAGLRVPFPRRVTHSSPSVTAADVERAAERIRPPGRHTPLEPSPALGAHLGAEVFLKLECWQVTGSFKPRISFSKLLTLGPAERARGVIASIAGGHGIWLAWAARALGIPARIFLPHAADPRKVAVMQRLGAALTRFGTVEEARLAAR